LIRTAIILFIKLLKKEAVMITSRKIALVTGAGSGIGRATALALFRAGYFVVLAGRRLDPLLETVAAMEDSSDGGQTMVVPTDVTDPESVTALFARIKDKLGRLDVLFNNAGTNFPGIPFEELSYEKWSAVVNVNLTGMFLCAQGAFRLMKEQTPQGAVSLTMGLFRRTRRVLIRQPIRQPSMA
jgi:NAD(P)-dependent dehydrogenase (short-subunit alcohol dehydrogenase family)